MAVDLRLIDYVKNIYNHIVDMMGSGFATADDSLHAMSVEISEILNLTRTGADIAVTAAETDLFIDDAPTKIVSGRSIKILCDNMQAGDIYTFKEKYRIEGVAPEVYHTIADTVQLSGVQTNPLCVIHLEDYRYGCKITAQKDAGVDRSFYIEAIRET